MSDKKHNNETGRRPMKERLLGGIDLHSNNLFCGIMNQDGKRVFEKRLPCDLKSVVKALKPFKKGLESIAVESTYNWYWLVDGLQDEGFPVVLANPAGMEQYNGIKHADDKSDAFFIADMLRLKILPLGYIADREIRPVRDLLRRRMSLVQKRTSLMLSLKSLHIRTKGRDLPLTQLKRMEPEEGENLFEHPCDRMISRMDVELINQLEQSILEIERTVLKIAKPMPHFQVLGSIPGVGKILSMTIALETVDPDRFASAGNYASYCRCVNASKVSNGKKKGENNRKCGNRYLGWAFVEAANFSRRFDDQIRKYFDRKTARTSNVVATKALACKLAKAAWHMMKENKPYDGERIFPGQK
jgi:transposase